MIGKWPEYRGWSFTVQPFRLDRPGRRGPSTSEKSPQNPRAAENVMAEKPTLKVLLCSPRGFCAGVVRAIESVERALAIYGKPVYVRHEIVHNRFVVERLRKMGAVFVDELDEVPDDRPVVFSAHGVPKSVPAQAQDRGLAYVDATCPLVSKVHRQAQRLIEEGRHILFIGHAGHPEVIGTFGQVPEGSITLIETVADVAALDLHDGSNLAFLTQTTLSVDDTAAIVNALKQRFPSIRAPRSEDICYATSNRQAAVKAIAAECDRMLVIGAPNSSNSLRLAEVAERMGSPARLIERAANIDWDWLGEPGTVGITAGASAPELLIRELVDALRERFDVSEEVADHTPERMVFKLPRELVASGVSTSK
jgi:4-hydroxy-3-methylbut-2-en-1-yl diphosphate reductase